MNVFASQNTDRTLWGLLSEPFPATWYQSANPGAVLLFAPVFAWLWIALARRNLEPSTPMKFALGLWLLGLAFIAMVFGAMAARDGNPAGAHWLLITYVIYTWGELCLSPVGLSAVTKLAVPSVVGVMMGAWFLATAYSEFVAAQISKLAAIDTAHGEVDDIAAALASYTELFDSLFWVGLGVGALVLVISPLLKKMMHGIH